MKRSAPGRGRGSARCTARRARRSGCPARPTPRPRRARPWRRARRGSPHPSIGRCASACRMPTNGRRRAPRVRDCVCARNGNSPIRERDPDAPRGVRQHGRRDPRAVPPLRRRTARHSHGTSATHARSPSRGSPPSGRRALACRCDRASSTYARSSSAIRSGSDSTVPYSRTKPGASRTSAAAARGRAVLVRASSAARPGTAVERGQIDADQRPPDEARAPEREQPRDEREPDPAVAVRGLRTTAWSAAKPCPVAEEVTRRQQEELRVAGGEERVLRRAAPSRIARIVSATPGRARQHPRHRRDRVRRATPRRHHAIVVGARVAAGEPASVALLGVGPVGPEPDVDDERHPELGGVLHHARARAARPRSRSLSGTSSTSSS